MLLICRGLNGGVLLVFDFLQHKLLFLLADFGEGRWRFGAGPRSWFSKGPAGAGWRS
jgi:hypothetical protein